MTCELSWHDQSYAAAIIELGPLDQLRMTSFSCASAPIYDHLCSLDIFKFWKNIAYFLNTVFNFRSSAATLYCFVLVTGCIFLGHCGSQSFQPSSPPYAYSLAQIPRLSPSAMPRPNMKSIPTPCPAHFATLLYSLNHNLTGDESSPIVFLTPCGAMGGSRDPTHT